MPRRRTPAHLQAFILNTPGQTLTGPLPPSASLKSPAPGTGPSSGWDRPGPGQPLRSSRERQHPLNSNLSAGCFAEQSIHPGRKGQRCRVVPSETPRINTAHIPAPSRTLVVSVCKKRTQLLYFCPLKTFPPCSTQRSRRGCAVRERSSAAANTGPQPAPPEQPLQSPTGRTQESKDQTEALGSFPSSSLHYLAAAINFFLS